MPENKKSREEDAGTQRRRRDQQRMTHQGPTGTWDQAKGGKEGRTDAGDDG